jgi:hypothetical protein
MTTPDQALDALDAATARYREMEQAHDGVVAAILAALRAGAGPTEVANRSPFTAAHVRKLAREAGIPPAKPGIKSKRGAKS